MKASSLQYMTSSSTIPTLQPVSLHPPLCISNISTMAFYLLSLSCTLYVLHLPTLLHSGLLASISRHTCLSHHPYISYQPCHVLFVKTDEDCRLGRNVWLILTMDPIPPLPQLVQFQITKMSIPSHTEILKVICNNHQTITVAKCITLQQRFSTSSSTTICATKCVPYVALL